MHHLNQSITILRRSDVESRTGLSRSTLYDWINPSSPRYKPDFPKPISYAGSSIVGWVEAELEQWLSSQVNGRAGKSKAPTNV